MKTELDPKVIEALERDSLGFKQLDENKVANFAQAILDNSVPKWLRSADAAKDKSLLGLATEQLKSVGRHAVGACSLTIAALMDLADTELTPEQVENLRNVVDQAKKEGR